MANVLFKRGSQSTLSSTTFTAQDGVFYLTTDTNRLYVGNGNNLELLNKNIVIKNSIGDLTSMSNNWDANQKQAHTWDFYYVAANGISSGAQSTHGGNILVVWDGTQWVQINPDTNTTIDSIEFSTTASSTDVATISMSTLDSNNSPLSSAFDIVGGTGVHVTASNTAVTLSTSTYSLSEALSNANDAITISLNNSDTSTTSDIRLLKGENITFTSTSNGIEISSTDTHLESASLTSDSAGNLSLDLTLSGNVPISTSVNNLGIALNDNTVAFLGQYSTATAGEIYSKAEIDQKLKSLDGMTFKGTLGDSGASTTALPTAEVKNGDTYLVSGNITFATTPTWVSGTAPSSYQTGDMIIATGTEGSDGYITAQSLQWAYVPSGDERLEAYDYSATVTTNTNSVVLHNALNTDIAGITLVSGTGIAISSTSTKLNGLGDPSDNGLVTTITHATVSTTETTASTLSNGTSSFTAIKSITVDNGHVTGIETDTFTPVTYSIDEIAVSTTANAATATFNLLDSGNGTTTAQNLNFESSSITFSGATATNTVVMDLVWGTF